MIAVGLNPRSVAWSVFVAFQREKPAAIGVKAPYPGFIEPELATSVDKVPSGTRWLHEIKFDGYRVQVHLRDAARGFRYGVAPTTICTASIGEDLKLARA